jgi:hypothetical protein
MMFPSKTAPITSPLALMIGEPELPPTMSFVVAKSKMVRLSSAPFAASHFGAKRNGGLPVARFHSPDKVVNAGAVSPRSVQPAIIP